MVEGGREAAMLWWMGAENAPPEKKGLTFQTTLKHCVAPPTMQDEYRTSDRTNSSGDLIR